MQTFPMTVDGAAKLRKELEQLTTVDRRKVIAAIAEARAHGDLSENAEYHAAKEQQGFIEARIRDIEAKLSRAQVIDVTQISESGRVIFGATVELYHLLEEKTVTYQIVGEDEADIKQAKVSITSPIARALIGKEEGEVVEFNTPSGAVQYEVSAVKHQ